MSAAQVIDRAAGNAFPRLARCLFGNVELDFRGGSEDRSRLVSAMFGTCRVSRLQADAHTVVGDHATSGSSAPDAIKLIIQTRGHSVLAQGGCCAPVGAEAIVLYDPSRPYVLTNSTAVRLLLLQLPRDLFTPVTLDRLTRPFVAPKEHAGLQRVLLSLMDATIREADRLDEAARASVGQTMVELVRTLLTVDDAPERAGTHSLDLLRRRAKDFIGDNLDAFDLDVGMVARRMGCSVRYVYRAFEAEGTTPSDYIWAQRLEAAASRLRASVQGQGEVSRVAFALGFSSSAHFARAFRKRYGLSPSEWRQASLS